jgi:hypothetical protein
MNTLTQQQINQYQWRVTDGVARIVNPFDTDFTAGLHDKFELWFKENSFSTNAPDGIYSGEAFEIVWQTSSIAKDDWTNCIYQEAYTAYMQGRPFRLFLCLKPSHLPAVLATHPGEEWKDRYKEVWEVLSWSREWQQDTDNTYNNYEEFKSYYKQLNWPTRQTWHLNTPPAEQKAETVEQMIEILSNHFQSSVEAHELLDLSLFDGDKELFERNLLEAKKELNLFEQLQSTLTQKDQRIAELEQMLDQCQKNDLYFEQEKEQLNNSIAEFEREAEQLKDKLIEINNLCGTVNFSSHNQMREAIEGAVELSELLTPPQH